MEELKLLKKKRQYRYFIKRCEGLHIALCNFLEKADPDQLHILRVEFKKIRSILLLQGNRSGKIDTYFKLLRKIFKRAGEIRLVQLHLELLKKYGLSSPVLKKELEEMAAQKTKAFRKDIPALKKKIKSGAENLKEKFQDTEFEILNRIVESEIQFPVNAFEPFSVKQIHEARKHIKNLLYFQDILSDSLKKEMKLKTDYLDQIQDSIGKWHDVELTRNLIRAKGIRNKRVVNKVRKDLALILKTIRTDVIDFRKKIMVEPLPD